MYPLMTIFRLKDFVDATMNWSNTGRILFGLFYLAAAFFNATFTLSNPQPFWEYISENALSTFFRDLVANMIISNSSMIIICIVLFELAVGSLIINNGIRARFSLC